MRQFMLTATLLFLGSIAGCACQSGGCGTGGCGSGGCGTGGCGNGGCGVGDGRLADWARHKHGICDCEVDEYCSSRSPWIRNAGAVAPPVESIQPPAKLPAGNKRDLEE